MFQLYKCIKKEKTTIKKSFDPVIRRQQTTKKFNKDTVKDITSLASELKFSC